MYNVARLFHAFFVILLISLSAGCGGGGGGGGGATSAPSNVTGVAAKGAPLANATVTIKDSAGISRTGITTVTGGYNIDVTGLTPPLLIKVVSADGLTTLYSVGTAAGVINTHPLTDMIIRTWYQVQSTTVDVAFANVAANPPPTAPALGVIKQVVKNLVANFLGLMGVDPANFDLISTPFSADATGFDGFLDNISFNPASGMISINTVSEVTSAPDYQASLTIGANGVLNSTVEEDLNNDGTFTTVSTSTNNISGITASPYAGAWQITATTTVAAGACGNDPIGTVETQSFTVDANGNFILVDMEYPGYIDVTGNIAANGTFTITAYGDTLLPGYPATLTCPQGSASGTMSSTSSGTGTVSQGGGSMDLTLTRITPSPFAGTWNLSYTFTVAGSCDTGVTLNVPSNAGALVIDAAGNFSSALEHGGLIGTVTSAGVVSFNITEGGAACGGTGSGGISSINTASGIFNINDGVGTGTWTLTRQ